MSTVSAKSSVCRIEKVLRIFSRFHQERCHRKAPILAVSGVGNRGFSSSALRTGSQNRVISGTHLCRRNAGWRPVRNSFHSRSFQNVAEADILRKLETEAEALPSNGANRGIPHWKPPCQRWCNRYPEALVVLLKSRPSFLKRVRASDRERRRYRIGTLSASRYRKARFNFGFRNALRRLL